MTFHGPHVGLAEPSAFAAWLRQQYGSDWVVYAKKPFGGPEQVLKYRDKLFTFLGHDGVAWNNNTAENAIKQFAYYREGTVGVLTEAGLADYLVLLSIYQTCRYRGVSFLKFLLSGERNVDAFCEHPRRKRQRPSIEVYPSGVTRPGFGPTKKQPGSQA